ncbi:hypothetical protein A2U01_0098017, partial [Trifolium medium]|nr:hypothetical protein [Trifolium medium]
SNPSGANFCWASPYLGFCSSLGLLLVDGGIGHLD